MSPKAAARTQSSLAAPSPPLADRRATASLPLRDAAYEAIKDRIVTCQFRPGEYLNEASVSVTLGIGRTPVRQAIDRLRLEGMVDVLPRKGVIVRPVSLDEVMQIIEVRLVNETYCARLAAERADETELERLTTALASATQWIEARNTERLMRLDREFHDALATASKNPLLADILTKLHERSLRFWFMSLNQPGYHQHVQSQHEAILSAIKGRDAAAAEKAMREHIEAFRRNLMHSM